MKKNLGIAGAVAITALVGITGITSCGPAPTSHTVTSGSPRPVHQTMHEQVAAWVTASHVSKNLHSVLSDLDALGKAADTYNTSEMTSACLKGVEDTTTLDNAPSYPARPVLWKATIHELDSAFTYCAAGDYNNATVHLTKATKDLADLNADISKYK